MTIRRTGGLGLLAALCTAAPALGQGKWVANTCDLKPGHFLVQAGLLYLKSAANGRFQEQIEKDLRDANRQLVQSITANGQDKNPAAWYYLGRYYVEVKDAAGADTAFRRAEQLAPTCKADIANWRRNQLWVPLYNAAVAAYNAGQQDSAIVLLQKANTVYNGEPGGFVLLGQLFFNANQPDSAAKYFRLAVAAATDPKYAADKRDAQFNVAASYARAQRWPDAAAAYRDYLVIAPNDARALAGLGAAYTGMGKPDSALGVFRTIVDHADSVDALALFYAGTAIFSSVPPLPDTAPVGASCRADARRASRTLTARAIAVRCDSVTGRQIRDYDASVATNYRLSAKAFEAGLVKNPYYRDALFNLTNTYLALRDSTHMLPMAQRLYAVDPMNRSTLRLLAQGFQFMRKPDSTLHYLTVSDSVMPVEVSVGSFQTQDQSASVSGLFTNLRAKPNAPFKVTFEFLDAKGAVVATQSVDVPAIEPGGNHAFQLQAIGAKIEAWRYKQS
jgi:tetratricopeptide (TPR) repeat protein